jgi:hypothetical protein
MEKRWLYLLAGILAGYGVLFLVLGDDRLAAAGFLAMSSGLTALGASVGKRVGKGPSTRTRTKCDKTYLPLN